MARHYGYDPIKEYEFQELIDMYEKEGHTHGEALELSIPLFLELRRLADKEKNFWRKVKRREITGYEEAGPNNIHGLNPDDNYN
jgi:hypothetical protein